MHIPFTNLRQQTITTIEELIGVNIDSRDRYNAAAQTVGDTWLVSVFTKVAARRNDNVTKLRALFNADQHDQGIAVAFWNGKESQDSASSLAGKTHKAWQTFHSVLIGGENEMVAIQAELGERHMREMYKEAVMGCVGSPVEQMLWAQFNGVKEDHAVTQTMKNFYA